MWSDSTITPVETGGREKGERGGREGEGDDSKGFSMKGERGEDGKPNRQMELDCALSVGG